MLSVVTPQKTTPVSSFTSKLIGRNVRYQSRNHSPPGADTMKVCCAPLRVRGNLVSALPCSTPKPNDCFPKHHQWLGRSLCIVIQQAKPCSTSPFIMIPFCIVSDIRVHTLSLFAISINQYYKNTFPISFPNMNEQFRESSCRLDSRPRQG